ncbi:MAG: hypothetical protein KA210_00935 [Bacteroidia bacterium]|nr:hypothetical protein [Bacteroidia bacterium]
MEPQSIMHDLISKNPHATKEDIIPEGIGDFGLVKTNPIPIYGIDKIETYFSSLRYIDESDTWLPVTYLRTNENDQSEIGTSRPKEEGLSYSTSADNIGNNIDVYNIYTFDGKYKLAMIYIHCYHWKNSNKSPAGFKLINNNQNEIVLNEIVSNEIVSNEIVSNEIISNHIDPKLDGEIGWIILGFVFCILGGWGGLLFGFNYVKKKYNSNTRIIGVIMIITSIIMRGIFSTLK